MDLDELRALRKLLAVCGITPEGKDPADDAPNCTLDLERVTTYVEALLRELDADRATMSESAKKLLELSCTCIAGKLGAPVGYHEPQCVMRSLPLG